MYCFHHTLLLTFSTGYPSFHLFIFKTLPSVVSRRFSLLFIQNFVQAIWKKYLFSINHHIFLKYTRVMRKNRHHLRIDVREGYDNLLWTVVSRFWPCGDSVCSDTTKAGQFCNNANMLSAFECCYHIEISLVLAYWSSNFHLKLF